MSRSVRPGASTTTRDERRARSERVALNQTLRDTREIIREEPLMHQPILRALRDGPLTVPEIAERIGAPAREVLIWVMGMRRYGHLVELPEADDDGYYRYATAGQGASQ